MTNLRCFSYWTTNLRCFSCCSS